MLSINHNQLALNVQRHLRRSNAMQRSAMQRLSSGLRINSAGDDVAGSAIANRMTAQIRGMNQAVRNANDGISLAQTAEGALQESVSILQRIRELAVQSANATNSGSDRASLQKEIGQLQQELNRIANTTAFNGKNLLDGSFEQQKLQVGANANQTISMSAGNAQATAIGAHQLRASAAGVAAAAGTTNNLGSGGIWAKGALGTALIVFAAGTTGRELAAAVNERVAESGVSARASTQLELKVTASGAISFTMVGQNLPSNNTIQQDVTISYNVNATGAAGKDDLSGFATLINSKTGSTGVTARLNTAQDGLILEQAHGYDIQLTGTADASGTLMVQGLQFDPTNSAALASSGGFSAAGAAVALAGATTCATVGGQVTFESGQRFSISYSPGTNIIGADSWSKLNTVAHINVATQIGANEAISVADNALAFLDEQRATFGALQNRLASTINNLQTNAENLSAARSQIQDADFAMESANLSRATILQQAGLAMLVQANQTQQSILQLLR